jgi:predicted dehydrogenase
MNLTAENRAIGVENFAAAIGSPLIRREFLLNGIRQGIRSGQGQGSYYFGYERSIGKPVRVGVLGTGDEGSVLIGAVNPEFIEIVAIADIRPYNIHRAFHGDWYSEAALAARPGLLAKYGWKTEDEARRHVRVYRHYEELLENERDIEGVIIALPLHLHAPAAIAALKRGLHVLTEKLMGHTVAECKEMARAAKLAKRHLATGHQRHYNILYDHAMELIRRGVLGELHYIRAQWHRANLPGSDSWQQPMPKSAKPDDALAGTLERELAAWERRLQALKEDPKASPSEIELWEKRVAQKRAQLADAEIAESVKNWGYQDAVIAGIYRRPAIEELIRWRLWDRTSGGLMAELGSHQLDAASLFIAAAHGGKKQRPLSVSAIANRPIFPPDRDVESHVYCIFEFPAPGYNPRHPVDCHKKIVVAYSSINGNGWGGYGETVFGTEGTLIIERELEAQLYRTHEINSRTRISGTPERPKLEIWEEGDERSAAIGKHALLEVTRGYTEELEHWAWCIRRNPEASDPEIRPRCHPEVALADAVLALTANMAARQGTRIDFDPEWFDPESQKTPEGRIPDLARYG